MRYPKFHLLLLALILFFSSSVYNGPALAVTGQSLLDEADLAAPEVVPQLQPFASSVRNGQAALLTGVYVPGVMALPIVQQPANDAGFVSTQPTVATQFRMASNYHSIGLLAHDFLAGKNFTQMKPGADVVLVYGDGGLKYYQVTEVLRFQALTPTSPYSNFIDLSSNERLSADQLFKRTYGRGESTLVLQTCISTDTVSSWGRLFVLARPLASDHPSLTQIVPVIEQALTGAHRSLSQMHRSVASR